MSTRMEGLRGTIPFRHSDLGPIDPREPEEKPRCFNCGDVVDGDQAKSLPGDRPVCSEKCRSEALEDLAERAAFLEDDNARLRAELRRLRAYRRIAQ